MYFSAPVSFAASALLRGAGVTMVKHATPRREFVAVILLIFSVWYAEYICWRRRMLPVFTFVEV